MLFDCGASVPAGARDELAFTSPWEGHGEQSEAPRVRRKVYFCGAGGAAGGVFWAVGSGSGLSEFELR